ncbi:hypothetical protein AIX81_21475 [Salmonella enterica]|nr:hypothetical protein [Salmonella enterica]
MQTQNKKYPVTHSEYSEVNVWLAGVFSYEVTGVELVLAKQSVRCMKVNSGTQITSRDTLILCLSSTPLIGWWRYLRLIQWLEKRYEIKLIVLCPARIFSMSIICGDNVIWLNGDESLISVSEFLYCALKEGKKDIIKNSGENISKFFWGGLMCLREHPSDEEEKCLTRKAYHRRRSLLRRLNLNSMHFLQVFMSGIKMRV